MVIIAAGITAILLLIFQINPITAVGDTFFIEKSRAEESSEALVLGASEIMQITEVYPGADKLPLNEEKSVVRPIIKEDVVEVEDITAKAALVMDLESNTVLYKKNINEVLPIASITKLMTALVVLEQKPDLTKKYVLKNEDRREGGKIYFYSGDAVTIKDLLYVSLIGSANTATVALVHSLGMEEDEFVKKINEKIKELKLEKTKVYDPVGLSFFNVSTAKELVNIINAAIEYPEIQEAISLKKYIIKTGSGRQVIVENTDDLLKQENKFQVLGGKTGYIGTAGFCFAGKFSNDEGKELVSVVLGSNSNDLRFEETEKLVGWAYESYIWPR